MRWAAKSVWNWIVAGPPSGSINPCLDDKTRALVRVAALVATGGGPTSYRRHVGEALTAGAGPEEVVGTLVAVARTVGLANLVSATVGLALGLGYDVERALEDLEPDEPPSVPDRSVREGGATCTPSWP
jgi:alkylhydroperoxidase/carboxymuconolactone decarboxylase family protein YurZ